MILSEASGGDVVRIEGTEYRLMIEFHDAWGCRIREGDGWGEHTWFTLDTEIEAIVKVNPTSNDQGADVDPIARRNDA